MKLYILADFDVNNPPIVGGIEKRIVAFKKGLDDTTGEIEYQFIKSYDIPFDSIKKRDLILTYSADNELLYEMSKRGKRVLNTVCSGMAYGESPKYLYNNDTVRLRFLSEALREAYKNSYSPIYLNYVFSHGFHKSEYNLSDEGRERKNIIWMASLGWGLHKGIREFVQMANDNRDYNFVAYAGQYNNDASTNLSWYLCDASKVLPNFKVYFNLHDEDKKEEFKKAKLFCSFSHLIEAGNVGNIEAIINNIPVATLNVPNNGCIDEHLGKFNFKFGRDNDLTDYLNNFNYEEYKSHAQEFSVDKEIEKIKQIYETF
jgi:hypothetical protein